MCLSAPLSAVRGPEASPEKGRWPNGPEGFFPIVHRRPFIVGARWRIASDSGAAAPRQTQTDNDASGSSCGA